MNLQMTLRFHEKSFDLELATASTRNIPLEGGVFRFDLDFWQTPTTFFGRSTDHANFVALPCYMHAPDAGTFHVTQSGDAAIFRQCASADDFNLSARQFMNIAPATVCCRQRVADHAAFRRRFAETISGNRREGTTARGPAAVCVEHRAVDTQPPGVDQ